MEREANIQRLIETLKDDDELVQTQAVGLLEEVGEPAVELLIVAAGDEDKNIREVVIGVLGIIGDLRAVEILINSLRDLNKMGKKRSTHCSR